MKFTFLLLTVACMQISARGLGQTVNLHLQNSKIETAFKVISQQTGYQFIYTQEDLQGSSPVSCDLEHVSLQVALDSCLKGQPLKYSIEEKYVVVTRVRVGKIVTVDTLIKGRIVNEKGEPVPGATVMSIETEQATLTNKNGEFTLNYSPKTKHIQITSAETETEEIAIGDRLFLYIMVNQKVGLLDEMVIRGYYSTSKRLSTGSAEKINSAAIERQPVSNPLAALQGKLAGLLVTQTNGLPGSDFSVLIRGMNSIQNGNSPLYIIDGVPFVNDADVLTQRSVINAQNPFNTIDPARIESIEVLKDADATAIYGSRGANGVILITTKSGKSGKLKAEVNVYDGWGKVTRTMKMMNTTQYLQMRREALSNDGVAASPSNAYDLLVWDSTRYTNFSKELIGGTAHVNNTSLQISGGTSTLNINSGINYYRESAVFPGNCSDTRFSIQSGMNYKSPDKKFTWGMNIGYSSDRSNLYNEDLTQFINLSPDTPSLMDSTGKLNWNKGGFSFTNPLSITLQSNRVETDRFNFTSRFQYSLLPGLVFRFNSGYNSLQADENNQVPISAQDPTFSPTGTAFWGHNTVNTWITEPQLDFNFKIQSKLKVQTLIGATWQENKGKRTAISGTGFTNDELLGNMSNATTISAQNHSDIYRYNALYSRINFNWSDKYLVNLTGRRDGSSRFGPGNQFANFGAIGLGWIFSKERIIAQKISFLSFGKLRFSFGTTGNDLIGNYQYLDSYSPTRYPYQGIPSLFPTKLYNPEYSWEEIKKTDIGTELGFLKDKIVMTFDWFINKSNNQIINYSLPGQTGFNSVLQNFPGVVSNSGTEWQVSTINLRKRDWEWKMDINLTVSKNKLLKFPGLAASSYAQRYEIGRPLTMYKGAHFIGVDPITGVYQFWDENKNPTFSPTQSAYTYAGTTDPSYYGGWENNLRYKNWELNFLLEFRKQMGLHPVYSAPSLVGDANNRPVAVLDRWQQTGDIRPYQRYTQTFGAAGAAIYPLFNSDAVLTNASFVRVKNISITYTLPQLNHITKVFESVQVYIQSQNAFVFTKYKGPDPETQHVNTLPPLRRFVAGLKLKF